MEVSEEIRAEFRVMAEEAMKGLAEEMDKHLSSDNSAGNARRAAYKALEDHMNSFAHSCVNAAWRRHGREYVRQATIEVIDRLFQLE